ncbi:MAG: recombinase RecA [Chloroflexota bacterium]
MAETADRQVALEEVARLLERRWGGGALQRLGSRPANDATVIPTGFAELDLALGVGGFARGRIVELCGHRSSGKVTLAAHVVVQAQRQGGLAAYVDVPHLLDPAYLAARGVDLEYLLIAQPENSAEALAIVETLVGSGGLDLIVFDSVVDLVPAGGGGAPARAQLLSASLRRLTGTLAGSPTVIIFINRATPGAQCGAGGRALRFYASLRLQVTRLDWLKEGEDVVGCRSSVRVLKNKLAPPLRSAEIEVRYENRLRAD